jgi:hypothetical protein
MAKRNPAFQSVDAFAKIWERLAPILIPRIRANIDKDLDLFAAVNKAFDDTKADGKIKDALLKGAIDSFLAGTGGEIQIDKKGFRDWFLNHSFAGDDLTLSQKLWRPEFKRAIVSTLAQQMRANETLLRAAKRITDQQLASADLAKAITELNAAARRVAAGDAGLYNEFRSTIKAAQSRVDDLVKFGAPRDRLQKAYQNMVRAAESMNEKRMDKAITRAIKAKARYNAERIARTEYAKAYGAGVKEQAGADPDVIGLRWELSSRHLVFDICDYNAGVDSFGLGAGGYPIDKLPEYPAHPNCLCVLTEIYKGQESGEPDPDAGKEFVADLSEDDQKKLLGVEGAAEFNDNENALESILETEENSDNIADVPENIIE